MGTPGSGSSRKKAMTCGRGSAVAIHSHKAALTAGGGVMLGSFLALGLLLGLKHALEADHLSTVATLASRSSSKRHTVGVAAAWGLGHAAALVVLGGALVALGATLPAAVVRAFELVVGIILIALGFDVLRRLRRGGLHPPLHEDGGARGPHAHRPWPPAGPHHHHPPRSRGPLS